MKRITTALVLFATVMLLILLAPWLSGGAASWEETMMVAMPFFLLLVLPLMLVYKSRSAQAGTPCLKRLGGLPLLTGGCLLLVAGIFGISNGPYVEQADRMESARLQLEDKLRQMKESAAAGQKMERMRLELAPYIRSHDLTSELAAGLETSHHLNWLLLWSGLVTVTFNARRLLSERRSRQPKVGLMASPQWNTTAS